MKGRGAQAEVMKRMGEDEEDGREQREQQLPWVWGLKLRAGPRKITAVYVAIIENHQWNDPNHPLKRRAWAGGQRQASLPEQGRLEVRQDR